MKGITLSVMSRAETPGYPAPESAWRVVATTALTPKRVASGANASAIITAEQLGLVTMNPRWVSRQASSRPRWSGLTSGMISGTGSLKRWAEELLITG